MFRRNQVFGGKARPSALGPGRKGTKMLVCRLPADDPWMQNMLRPIVEAAGYRVVDEAAEDKADLVIAAEDKPLPEGDSGKLIRLRANPEPADGE